MATAASIRAQVYDYLYGAYPTDRPFESLVTEALDTSETDIDVTDGNDWSKGDILEVAETGELCLVLSVASNTLTVKRSYGTVAASSATINGIVRKNPRFSQEKVDSYIKQSLNLLGDWGIHNFASGSVTLAASQLYFEVTETDIFEDYGIISVYYVDDDTKQPTSLPFRQHYHLDTTDGDWSQGYGITILNKGDRAATDPVYFTYCQSYDYDTDLDTTIAKLRQSHEELVVLGAVVRLMGATIAPATQDPGARTDRTTPPGQTGRDGRWFQGEFFIKVRAAAASLAVRRQRIAPGSVRTERAGRWRA